MVSRLCDRVDSVLDAGRSASAWLLVVPWLALASVAEAQDGRSVPVRAQVVAGTYFVGQAIELRVSVEGRDEAPEVTAMPQVPDADVAAIDAQPQVRQLSANAIGDVVNERSLYTFRYRLVAHRGGTLVVPPVKVRLGERAGASAPVRVRVRPLPSEGRPASFLGGVGRLQVEAVADPTTLREGQTLDFQIRLFGPAARGSRDEPNVGALSKLAVEPEVESLPPEEVADPPSRTFRYRLRPTRAGEAVLPPVQVSFFDPRAERYQTRVTEGIPIRVVAVPHFDASSFQYTPERRAGRSIGERLWRSRWGPVVLGALSVLVLWPLVLAAFGVFGRVRYRLETDPVRFARAASRRFDPRLGAGLLAEQIVGALAHYLRLASGRPEGALTPLEARLALADLTDDAALAGQAEVLLRRCDRARFAGRPASTGELATEARMLFGALGRLPRRREGHEVDKNRGRHSGPPQQGDPHVPPDDIQQLETCRQ